MTATPFRELRRAYGFDEVAIVPGNITVNPDQTDIELKISDISFPLPILASAMDAVVDPAFAILFHKHGGMAVLNLEGLMTRYDNPYEAIEEITQAPSTQVTPLLQKIYTPPIKEKLVGDRVHEIKRSGARAVVSLTPTNTKKLAPLAVEAGADILVVQSTVTTARHVSKSYKGLAFSELQQSVRIPVIVGNCVSYESSLELIRTGISGVLVGVGPGAACTSREVLGIGVPQVTATMDCAAARDTHFRETGRYVAIITDGGFRSGGDICKAIASGADGVMLGSLFAQAKEAPGRGYHWGMASPHAALPRGTRIKVGTRAALEQILFGPTSVTDGTENIVGALRTCMGVCGAFSIKDMHSAQMVVAPAIKTEGKQLQAIQACS
ncbi:MAG: GuaB3 family IMP dehydrogenase-related protein [Chloroflexi bacterium]|nr:GuaB3 family IMP dehydrogenase-related protein [Chloroflexota bacterium]